MHCLAIAQSDAKNSIPKKDGFSEKKWRGVPSFHSSMKGCVGKLFNNLRMKESENPEKCLEPSHKPKESNIE